MRRWPPASLATATPEHISAALAAMELTAEQARGTIRLSVGWYTSDEEIDRAADLLLGAWEALS